MPPLPDRGTSGVMFCPHTTVPRELQKDHERQRPVPWLSTQADGSLNCVSVTLCPRTFSCKTEMIISLCEI